MEKSGIVIVCHLNENVLKIIQENDKIRDYIKVKEIVDIEIKNGFEEIHINFSSKFDDSLFIKIIDNISELYEFSKILDFLKIGKDYFDKFDITHNIIKKIIKWVNCLGKSSYIWNNLTNRPDYSLELYNNRSFPYYHIKNKEWKKLSLDKKNSNYPPTKSNPVSKDDSLDFSKEIEISKHHNNFMGYSILNPKYYENVDNYINCLFNLIYIKEINYSLEALLRLCLTPSCVHIIKHKRFKELVKIFTDHDLITKDIINYVMYYSNYIIRHENIRMFSKVSRSYRVLYTYEELYNQIDTNNIHIERDPYIQQLPGDTFISQTTPFYLRRKRKINSKEVFKRRFFLATGGALENIDLKKFKASVSGSILLPCITDSPLEKRFYGKRIDTSRKIKNIEAHSYYKLSEDDISFLTYLEYFYPSYDSLTDKEYKDEVLTKKEDILKFDMKKYIENKEKTYEKENEEEVLPDYNKLADIDIGINSPNFDKFREIVNQLFKIIRKNVKFRGPIWIKEIETLSSFKFKIYGPGLTRPIDMFRIPYDSSKMVKKFHLPCIKMWYEGVQESSENDVLIYDSAVRALKSGVNENYKWFSCNKICVDVILKYTQRGFTTILNKLEREILKDYVKSSKRWKNLVDDVEIFGVMDMKHKFFYPANFDSGIRMNLRNDMFKENEIYYSKRHMVSYPKNRTPYGGDLTVKTNNSIIPPNISNVIKLMYYLNNGIESDEE